MKRLMSLTVLLSLAGPLQHGLHGAGDPAAAGNDPAATVQDEAETGAAPDVEPADEGGLPFPTEFDVGEFARITLHGDLWLYHIRTEDAYHTRANAAFTELTARFGMELAFPDAEWLTGEFRIVANDVYGRPDNWTAPSREDFGLYTDLANITISGVLAGLENALTVGVQEIAIGDGFLIYDGYSDKRAVWTTPINSFPAVRWTVGPADEWDLDLFAAIFSDDHLSYEAYLGSYGVVEGGGQLYGANFNLPSEKIGTLDVGLFLKDEDIRPEENAGNDTGSNTWALSLRDSKDIGLLNLTGEVVKQGGRTRVVQNSFGDGSLHTRDAWGGQLTATYSFAEEEDAPYVRGRYAYFGGDRPGSSDVESFDPFFYGFADWGSWYLGDMTSYTLTNTNSKVVQLEGGFAPFDETLLRVFLYDFTLVEKTALTGGGRQWGNEVNVVFDYYPCDYAFLGAMVGAAVPDGAAETFNGDDETQTEVMGWVGFYF